MVQLFMATIALLCVGLGAIQVRENRRTHATARARQAEAERIVRRID